MDLHGGEDHRLGDLVPNDGVFDDDEVVLDDAGDMPPNPENPADLDEPCDPLQEESPDQPQLDGPQGRCTSRSSQGVESPC